MIPKIIHYCWFGRSEMPDLAKECIFSWHRYMPDYEYRLWNEDTFDVDSVPYTAEAYRCGQYAFVSDYVRLKALCTYGGIYMDVDFEVYKSFDELLGDSAFAGFEGSKHLPVMMGVCGSVPGGEWVSAMSDAYHGKHFMTENGMDMTPNVTFLSGIMRQKGLVPNGQRQRVMDMTVYPVDFFCPRQTTGEYFRTDNTFCEHRGLDSWSDKKSGWKDLVLGMVTPRWRSRLIKLKRKLIG